MKHLHRYLTKNSRVCDLAKLTHMMDYYRSEL